MVTKASDVKQIIQEAIGDPQQSFPAIMTLARSADWKEREVAATILVETGKKKPGEIIEEMLIWADYSDPNMRRAPSEGLRSIARRNPALVLPVLAKLKGDSNIYVKKSVANVLRNAGNYHPEFVLQICEDWAREANEHTAWIVNDGLRKLKKEYADKVEEIVALARQCAANQ